MKISKIASIAIVSSAAFLVGCGSSSHHSSTANKTVKIKASDAYVVALPSPATLTVGTQTFKTQQVQDGIITFTVPANVNLNNPDFKIPGNAIVDTDGNGKLSVKDQFIRMPLETATVGSVANPIATAALERANDNKADNTAYNIAKNFDPVQAKKDLILNPNDTKTKALVAISDGIAYLASQAKAKGKDPLKVIEAVNTDVIDNLASNSTATKAVSATSNSAPMSVSDIVQQVVAPAAKEAGVNVAQITQKVNNLMTVINTAAQVVATAKAKGLSSADIQKLATSLTVTVVAVSDANINPETVIKQLDTVKTQIKTAKTVNINAITAQTVQTVIKEVPKNKDVTPQLIEQQQKANNAANNAQNNANNAAENAQNNANSAANNPETNTNNISNNPETNTNNISNNPETNTNNISNNPETNTNNISNNNIQGNLINGLLKVDTLTIGGEYNVTYNSQNQTFNTLKLPADGNYSKYFNVKLDATCAKAEIFKGNVELNVTKTNSSYVDIFIPETITCKSAGEKPITTISKGTKVEITTNVAKVVNALGGSEKQIQIQPQIYKNLTNNDLKVNLQQLESVVTKNENKIRNLENNLSDFLQKDSNYTVTITIKNKNGKMLNKIEGNVKIGNDSGK